MITTERLVLRPWEESDATDLYNIAKNDKVALPCGWMPHDNVEESLMLIKTVLNISEIYAICLKETEKPIGRIGLKVGIELSDVCEQETEAEVGYWVGEEFWGNGFVPEVLRELMKYGFEELGLTKIWCNHFDGNTKSKSVKDKLGFKYVKTINNYEAKRINKIVDLHVSVITKEEWNSGNNDK